MSTFDTARQQIEELRAIKLQQPEVYKKIVEAMFELEGWQLEPVATRLKDPQIDRVAAYKENLFLGLSAWRNSVDPSFRNKTLYDCCQAILKLIDSTNSEIQLNLLNSDYGRLGIVKQDGKPLRFIPELEHNDPAKQPEADAATTLLNSVLESYMPTPEQQAKDFQDMAAAHKALMNNEPISGKLEAIKLVKIIKPKTYTIKNKDNEVGLICSRIIGCVNENKEVLPDLFAQPTEILCTGTDIEVSDGYHTMTELYEHRNRLFIALCRALTRLYICRQVEPSFVNECKEVWRSKTEDPEWFLLGIETVPEHQITYYLHISLWSDTEFAYTRETAPEFDGHTSNDVLERLKNLL